MDLDEFLAECDDVIEDWEGSDDSATWMADGSHQVDEIGVVTLEQLESMAAAVNRVLETVFRMYSGVDFVAVARRLGAIGRGAQSHFVLLDESTYWPGVPHPITDETLALLGQPAGDPMEPPAYLYRPTTRSVRCGRSGS